MVIELSYACSIWRVFFFFQAEDGIRDIGVTGVQTCALRSQTPLEYWITRPSAQLRTGAGDPVFQRRLRSERTRLNSSHANISYAVFCLKKKKKSLGDLCVTLNRKPPHTSSCLPILR